MPKFENLGYCPFSEVIDSEETVWKEFSKEEQGYRKALWELIGPYIVYTSNPSETDKLFFGTVTLADHLLGAIIRRYDFSIEAPIWITKSDNSDNIEKCIEEYNLNVVNKNPLLIFSPLDPGKFVVIIDGDKSGEIKVIYWDIP